MQIHGPSQVHGPHAIKAPHILQRAQETPGARAGGMVDRVEISAAAEAAAQAAETGGIRTELVNLIRGQIAAGTYDTPEKMDVALERLLDQLGELRPYSDQRAFLAAVMQSA